MKDFTRKYPTFSLCGLNCAFCTMNLGGYCPGCGGGEGNQSCRFNRCVRDLHARERGSSKGENLEFCWQCEKYPCERYENAAEYDTFLSHQAMFRDAQRAKKLGISAYLREQGQKAEILRRLLDAYNDGRKKTLYSTAMVLLDLPVLRDVMTRLETESTEPETLSLKERSALAAKLLQAAAQERGVSLKLKKKPKIK